jgi:hypothetical protein
MVGVADMTVIKWRRAIERGQPIRLANGRPTDKTPVLEVPSDIVRGIKRIKKARDAGNGVVILAAFFFIPAVFYAELIRQLIGAL